MKFTRLYVLLFAALGTAFCQIPVVVDSGVLNAASFDKTPGAAIAPGSLVSIFGTDLAGSTAANDTVPLSTILADSVSVTFNGIPAGLDFVSAGQINAQLPWNVIADGSNMGVATVVVTRGSQSSAAKPVNVAPVVPGIFTVTGTGLGYAVAAIFPDNAYALPTGMVSGLTSRPAKTGDVLTLYATGLGPVDIAVPNGGIPPAGKLANTVAVPTVLIGGVPGQVLFSGLAPQFPGVYLINVQIPPGVAAGSTVPVQIQVNGGAPSSSQVMIAIQ